MMSNKKVVIAPDSFKESLSAFEVAGSIEKGFMKVFPNWTYVKVPMADGGEGTVQSLVDATGGSIQQVEVIDPLGRKVHSFYGLSGDRKVAIIEMAAASGLELIQPEERDVMSATSYGLGELILAALNQNVEEILIGLGGSATNDAGAGMIQCLGGKLLDKNGEEIPRGGAGLSNLARIDLSGLDERLEKVTIQVACDVTNPLTGPNGASAIYGPQKGATEEQVEHLDKNLKHFARIAKRDLDVEIDQIAGAGAAGGLGGGLNGFLQAKLERGGDLVVQLLDLDERIKDADLVITGEGGMNHQTVFGKTPVVVAKVAKKYNVPVIAFVGSYSEGYEKTYDEGIDAVFSILSEWKSLDEILQDGAKNLEATAYNVAKLLEFNQ